MGADGEPLAPYASAKCFLLMIAGSPSGIESSEVSIRVPEDGRAKEEQLMHEQEASTPNFEPSSLSSDARTDETLSPKTAESADLTNEASMDDPTVPAEDQSKGHSSTSPAITSPLALAKPSHPSDESADSAATKGSKDNFVVSISLSLVRLSRRAKSRSSSKDFVGKCCSCVHSLFICQN